MTSVSELFYQRRSRFGRNPDPLVVGSDLASPPPPNRTSRRHRSAASTGGNQPRRNRLDPDGCDPLRRSRQPSLHRSSHPPQERESVRLEEAGHQFSFENNSRSETHQIDAQDRVRFSGNESNDRLPGAVLLARERLLQRLRGVTLSSSSRRSNRSSSGIHRNDIAIGDDFRLVDAGDWETDISREWIAPATSPVGPHPSKRPPGLTQKALSRLRVEVFCDEEESEECNTSRASRECSICLETFFEGDELIHLPCNHRYHFHCLNPWIRTCGDCPYCRRSIDINFEGVS